MRQAGRVQVLRSTIARSYVEGANRRVTVDVCDWGETCCWACGYYKEGEEYAYKSSDKNPYKCWDRADYLERAHIIPFAITKDNSPENFVLLCKECHKKNPNFTSYKMYQVWLDSVEHWLTNRAREYQKAFDIYGLSAKQAADKILGEDGGFTADFNSFLEENSIVVGGSMSPVTVAASMSEYCKQAKDVEESSVACEEIDRN